MDSKFNVKIKSSFNKSFKNLKGLQVILNLGLCSLVLSSFPNQSFSKNWLEKNLEERINLNEVRKIENFKLSHFDSIQNDKNKEKRIKSFYGDIIVDDTNSLHNFSYKLTVTKIPFTLCESMLSSSKIREKSKMIKISNEGQPLTYSNYGCGNINDITFTFIMD